MWALENLDGLTAVTLINGIKHEHPQVRRNAARVSEVWVARHPDVSEALLKLVDDPDASVRFELALVLGNWHDVKAGAPCADRPSRWGRPLVPRGGP